MNGQKRLLFSTIGNLTIHYNGYEILRSKTRAALVLFYLMSIPEMSAPRRDIARLFWPQNSDDKALSSLRQVLSQLRKIPNLTDHIDADKSHIRIKNLECVLDIDMIFNDHTTLAEKVLAQPDAMLPLLTNINDENEELESWLRDIKTSLHKRLLDKLHHQSKDTENPIETRIIAAYAAQKIDPFDEISAFDIIDLHAKQGKIAKAIAYYNEFYQLYLEELDSDPPQNILNLIAEIKLGKTQNQYAQPVTTPDQSIPTLAILEFDAFGPDPIPSGFCQGLQEDLINSVCQYDVPKVLSQRSIVNLKTIPATTHNVDYILSGSIRHNDNRFKITAQLQHGTSQYVLWSNSIVGHFDAAFDFQEELAIKIVGHFSHRLIQNELETINHRVSGDLKAYQYVLKARELLFRVSKKDHQNAMALVKCAREMFPNYTALSIIAAELYMLELAQFTPENTKIIRAQLFNTLNNIVALSHNHGVANAMLAHFHSTFLTNHIQAKIHIDRAIAASPGDAQTLLWCVPTLVNLGQIEQALDFAKRALARSPYDPLIFRYYHFYAIALFHNEHYHEAAEYGEKCRLESPNYLSNLRLTAASYAALNDTKNTTRFMQYAQRLNPNYRIDQNKFNKMFLLRNQSDTTTKFYAKAGFEFV